MNIAATSPTPPRKHTLWYLLPVLILLIAGGLWLHFHRLHQADASPVAEHAPWALQTGPVARGRVASSIQSVATVEAPNVITLAPQIQGTVLVVDGKSVLIGSMNLDPRSRQSNTEIAVQIESAVLAGQLHALFAEASAPDQAFQVGLTVPGNPDARLVWTGRENGKPVHYSSEPLAGAWRRIVAGLLGAFAPEELL